VGLAGGAALVGAPLLAETLRPAAGLAQVLGHGRVGECALEGVRAGFGRAQAGPVGHADTEDFSH